MKRLVPLTLTVLGYLPINAQDTATRPYRHFSTQSYQKQMTVSDAAFNANLIGLETFIKDYGTTGNGRADQIGVVFHILYNEGSAYPGLGQVHALVEALNRDFGQYTPPTVAYQSEQLRAYEALAQDPFIKFCLPVLVNDTATTGPVQFVETNVPEWGIGNDMKSSLTGGSDPLDPAQYLNIWVCNLKENSAGFAQMPGGPGATDGIVIDYDFLPGFVQDATSPYKNGRTLSHLVGNYLGLYDLWNDGTPCADDGVADTPIHNAPNFEMPAPDVRHIAFCPDGPVDEMLMNFMDNTDDASQNMFTLGQKSRMKAVLSENGPRAGLKAALTSCGGQNIHEGDIGSREKTTGTKEGGYKIQLFPNPSRGNITLKLKGDTGTVGIAIYNGFGVKMMETACALDNRRQTLQLKCEGWPPGLYYVSAQFPGQATLNTVFSITR